MRILNLIRNNFFAVFIFSILLLPNVVGAEESKYLNLYSQDQTVEGQKISFLGLETGDLKLAIKSTNSTFDTGKISTDNTYRVNTDNNSTYYYDPTPNNKTNNDDVLIASVTNKGVIFTPKVPPLKESADGNKFLNDLDVKQGLPPGTTLAAKNKSSVLAQERIAAQKTYDDALAAKKAADAALSAYQGSDEARRAALEKAVRDANLAEQNAGRAAVNAGNQVAQLQQQQANTATAAQQVDTSSCSLTNLSIFSCTVSIVSWTTNIIFKLVSFVAYIAGTLFDYSLELSINSAEFFKKLGVIEVTWSFIRDILNMTFIFILLWTAVQILIGNDAKYNAKQVLTKVIIVAILINFSLFAAKLMVDASNIVSLKIYEAMKSNTESTNATISERIMNTVGLSTLYNISEVFTQNNTKVTNGCANNPGALITVSIMGSIFLIILTLALGLAAILFLVRLVNIVFLFIKSPLWVWGYVLPGNQFVTKQKDEWWAQMKHVLVFPIAYLFWMLVAVIIFEKLGTAKNGTPGGLLELICAAPGTQNGGAAQTISLVAIFCIVIIFMMKAIEYGVKNATGPQGSLGGDFSKTMANKFAGYQTAMTKGLARKAGQSMNNGVMAVGNASVGAARGSLKLVGNSTGRVAGAVIGATSNGLKGENVWKGTKDGFFNSGITTKEALRDLARKTVAKTEGGALDYLGVTSAAAKLADKYKEPVNSDDKTKKQADALRSEKAVADETRRKEALEEQFKILSHKDWKKKNSSGTIDQYKDYVSTKIESRTDAVYGKDVTTALAANGKTHLENLRKAAIIEYEEDKRDPDGKIMTQEDPSRPGSGIMVNIKEKKVRFDEYAMHGAIQKMAKEDAVKIKVKNKKTKFTTFRNVKSEARIKALETHEKTQRMTARKKTDDENKTRKFETDIPDLKQTIEKMQKLDDVKTAVDNKVEITIHPVDDYNGEKIRSVNSAIKKYNLEAGKPRGGDPSKIIDLESKLTKAHEAYIAHVKETKEKLARKESEHMEHLAKLDEKK